MEQNENVILFIVRNGPNIARIAQSVGLSVPRDWRKTEGKSADFDNHHHHFDCYFLVGIVVERRERQCAEQEDQHHVDCIDNVINIRKRKRRQ